MNSEKPQVVTIESKYNGSLTREQFLFHEMRTTHQRNHSES